MRVILLYIAYGVFCTGGPFFYAGKFFFLNLRVILPFFMEFEESGEFNFISKQKRAAFINFLYILLYIFIAIVCMICVKVAFGDLDGVTLKPIIMAGANSLGLVIMMICLGFSAINVPREMFKGAKLEGVKNLLYIQAFKCQDQEDRLFEELKQDLRQIHTAYQRGDNYFSTEQKKKLETLLNSIPDNISRMLGGNFSIAKGKLHVDKLTYSEIVNLNKRVQNNIKGLHRLQILINKNNQRSFAIEDLLDSKYCIGEINGGGVFGNVFSHFKERFMLKYKQQIFPKLKATAGITLAILSAILITCEISPLWYSKFNEVLKGLITGPNSLSWLLVFTLIWAYSIVLIHCSIFKVKIEGFYGLYGDSQTDVSSQLYSSINFARVCNSICFNFLGMLNISDSNFNRVIGKLNQVPQFGNSLPNIFPILLIVFVLIEIFDIYGKLLSLMGFRNNKDCEISDDKSYETQEGKKIIMKAKLNDDKKKLKFHKMSIDNFKFYNSPNLDRNNNSQLSLMEGNIFNFASKTDFNI